jgi:hypothetical protein
MSFKVSNNVIQDKLPHIKNVSTSSFVSGETSSCDYFGLFTSTIALVEYIKYNKMAQKCCIRILYHELINNAH